MSRVTPTEVKEIIDTELTDPVIQIWIDAASTIVDDNADCINSTKLKQVELHLSAHFIAMLDPSTRGYVTKEKVEGLDTSYSNPANISNTIDNTTYGTTANMLSDGCLANSNKSAVKMFALGNTTN